MNKQAQTDALQVANMIRAQLGGNRFAAMTGAHSFVGDTDSLSFQIGRNDKGVTHVRIVLDSSDTYAVTFYKYNRRTLKLTTLGEESGVYVDSLRRVFTAHTGLLTSL